jgi:LasA protease
LQALMQANGLSDPNLLSVGQTLTIPAPSPGDQGPDFKIIPDSELVYSPSNAIFDVNAFIQKESGYLANYSEDVSGETLSGAEIITRVAQNYSVNPRLLLAILEHQSGWVTEAAPSNLDYPIGLQDAYHQGLYLQLTWTANTLNRGYYLWRVNAISTLVLADGSVVPIAPTINAGTAGVQAFFASLDDTFTWQGDTTAFGLFQTYFFLFGNPFDYAVEPLVPSYLVVYWRPARRLGHRLGLGRAGLRPAGGVHGLRPQRRVGGGGRRWLDRAHRGRGRARRPGRRRLRTDRLDRVLHAHRVPRAGAT